MNIKTLNQITQDLQDRFDALQSMDFQTDSNAVRQMVLCIQIIESLVSLLDDVTGACPERMVSNLKLLLSGEKSKFFFSNIVYPELPHLIYLCNNSPKISNHGGARDGSGRKPKRPTKQIRIDSDLAESFKLMSDYYQSLDDDGRRDFDNRFSTSGLLFPNG
ncbi:hypothetical protein QTV43_003617 [Vibrio vulnificus]|nr:hypothetical protein [Vibrio vulnificus]